MDPLESCDASESPPRKSQNVPHDAKDWTLVTPKPDATFLKVIIAGESGLGKSTFIRSFFGVEHLGHSKDDSALHLAGETVRPTISGRTTCVQEHRFTFSKDEKAAGELHLTVVDTPGYGDHSHLEEDWDAVLDYVDDQNRSFLRNENAAERQSNFADPRVDCCFYFIAAHRLKGADIIFMKKLQTRVSIIPVIAKVDTMTTEEVAFFKEEIRERLRMEDITVLDMPEEGYHSPYGIIGSEKVVSTRYKDDGKTLLHTHGREYSWGTAKVEDETHCDFVSLQKFVSEQHPVVKSCKNANYERWRTRELKKGVWQNLKKRVGGYFKLSNVITAIVLLGLLALCIMSTMVWYNTQQELMRKGQEELTKLRSQVKADQSEKKMLQSELDAAQRQLLDVTKDPQLEKDYQECRKENNKHMDQINFLEAESRRQSMQLQEYDLVLLQAQNFKNTWLPAGIIGMVIFFLAGYWVVQRRAEERRLFIRKLE